MRSAKFPAGFPWLLAADKTKADFHNNLISFLWRVMAKIEELKSTCPIVGFAEHPEDLGRVLGGQLYEVPASIWRMQECTDLVAAGWCAGLRQCDFDAPTPKPTRCLASSHKFEELAMHGLPTFRSDG